jgi:acetyl-CoA C-acetyltransferase
MNAIMEVDQGAAFILTSRGEARALGIPEERWIHWWGGGDTLEDPWFLSERSRLDVSPSLGVAASHALASAGVGIDDIDAFDLYSCFPSAVEIACDELGIDIFDPRPLTVTGGLPYAGGPGSNYATHAIARMMERLRSQPGARGLVTGVGWYLSKHSACVLGSAPPTRGSREPAPPAPHAQAVVLALRAEGRGRIETYTVGYDREGAPASGTVVGRLDDGRRFLAQLPKDRALLESLVASEAVGLTGQVRSRDERNEFAPDSAR